MFQTVSSLAKYVQRHMLTITEHLWFGITWFLEIATPDYLKVCGCGLVVKRILS